MQGIQAAFVGIVASRAELSAHTCAGPALSFGVVVDRHWLRVSVFGEAAEQAARSLQLGDFVYVEGGLSLDLLDEPAGPMKVQKVLRVSTRRCERLCNNIGRDVAPWLGPTAPLDLVAEDDTQGDQKQLPAPDNTDAPH